MKIIGKQIREGEYQGKKFVHCILYVSFSSKNVEGLQCDVLKFKGSVSDPYTVFDSVVLGEEYNVLYDRFGNCCSLVPIVG